MNTSGDRLRGERIKLGLSQEAFAARGGVKKLAQINYEQGRRQPDAEYLRRIAEIGADVAYILTGTNAATRQVLSNVRAATDAAMASGGTREEKIALQETEFHRLQGPRFGDLDRLAAAISAVEEGLAETRRKLPPTKRAELIFAAYQLMAEPEQSRDNVIALVRSAA